ncbi:hypothetical protein MHU86_18240 [Fragilaria crotonensis]|nr:hypothetical protein MHU86_18240 [Fragilaria crotonensis]
MSAENGAAVAVENTYFHDTPGAFSVYSGNVTAASQLPVENSFTRYSNDDDAEIGETRTNILNQSRLFVLEAEAVNDSGIIATAVPTKQWHKRRCFWVGAGFVVVVLVIVIIVVLVRPAASTSPSPPSVTPQASAPTSVPQPESNLTSEQIACNFIERPSLTECRATDSISKTTGSKIPSEIGLLTADAARTIPSSFGNLTEIDYLDFANNGLTGTVPSSFGNLKKLTALSFHENDLTGTIPLSVAQLTQLLHFDISSNRFNGQIPSSIGTLTQITSLSLYFNEFTGDIPSSIANMTLLVSLDFSHNRFIGTIPPSFERLSLLTYLTFSDNKMTGSIPSSLASLTNLTGLLFDQNAFTGSIASSMCSILSGIKIDCGDVQCSCCVDGVTNTAC